MIRRTATVMMIVFCLAALPSMAQTRVAFTIGGNYWYAQRNLSGDYWQNIKSKAGNMIGPYASLRVGKYLLGSSMFFGTFSEYGINDELYGRTYSFSNKRSDLNFSLGYSIFGPVNVFLALKYLSFDGEDDNPASYNIGSTGNSVFGKRKITDKGVMVGLGVSGVLRSAKSPLFAYWSAAYLKGQRTTSDHVTTGEGQTLEYASGYKTSNGIIALGGGLGIQTNAGIAILVGYRADILDFKSTDGDTKGKENLGGITITLAYTLP